MSCKNCLKVLVLYFFATLSRTLCVVVADPSLGNSEIKNNTITYTLLHTFSGCAESLKFLLNAF